MNVSITTVAPAGANEWAETWAACDYATYFHSPEWADLWQGYSRGRTRPRPLRVTFSDGRHAILPLSTSRSALGMISTHESSPAGTFGGWIAAEPLEVTHGRALASYLVNDVANVTWRTNPFDPLAGDLDIATRRDDTQALELSDGFDSIFRTWSKGHRAAVKQAQREGVRVRIAESTDDWRAYYAAYEDSVARWGADATVVYRWDLFERLSRAAADRVRLWLALRSDRVIAGALCLYASRHVAYWHGASLAEEFKRRPGNLLLYEAIRDACERGCAWFDFNPSGDHEGVRSFKSSFGTRSLPSGVVRTRSLLARVLETASKVVNR